jgi:hypothetical protein
MGGVLAPERASLPAMMPPEAIAMVPGACSPDKGRALRRCDEACGERAGGTFTDATGTNLCINASLIPHMWPGLRLAVLCAGLGGGDRGEVGACWRGMGWVTLPM